MALHAGHLILVRGKAMKFEKKQNKSKGTEEEEIVIVVLVEEKPK